MDVSSCGFRVRLDAPAVRTDKAITLLYRDRAIPVRPLWSREFGAGCEAGLLREEIFLLRSLNAGHSDSLFGLVAPYMQSLRMTIRSILRNAADEEEVLQESLLRVLGRVHQFHPERSFRAWLLQIATNEALKHRRDNRKHLHSAGLNIGNSPGGVLHVLAHPGESPEQALQRKELHDAVTAALAALNSLHREIFVLCDLNQLGIADVAARLGIKLDTAYTRLRRARLIMRKELARLCMEPRGGPKGIAES
jgi:RNA polymerase sigma-70 factor (ECF subfamily)